MPFFHSQTSYVCLFPLDFGLKVVKLDMNYYAYATNITLQFMLIYVYTRPGGSPLMEYLLERTYLCIHLHLLRIEVIQSWYVGHFHKK